jgi:hypothetical protein
LAILAPPKAEKRTSTEAFSYQQSAISNKKIIPHEGYIKLDLPEIACSSTEL